MGLITGHQLAFPIRVDLSSDIDQRGIPRG